MKVRRVEVDCFRGIKKLTWDLGSDFVCLIGPGDSTKTTILDAIELALTPRWNHSFYDTDFYNVSTESPIFITVTVGELPDEFKSDAKFGYSVRGWTPAGTLRDEPANGDELVLSIQLRVDSSLEPSWLVINDRNPEGVRISAQDREKLGCVRLGDYIDRHFSWGRGSVLSKLTTGAEALSGVLAEAGRSARNAVADLAKSRIQTLHDAAAKAEEVGAELGVAARTDFCPHLDVQAVSVGTGGLSLHEGKVPIRMAGLGTRRLLAVAMQREVAKSGGVTLVDEVEHALEPHRIRRLLRVLRGQDNAKEHVVMTTHSPVVLQELDASDLRVVRCKDGVTEVLQVEESLQPVVRKASEALLARKVLVCEGKTELGHCRRLDAWWSTAGASFGLAGVALADGNGTEAPKTALALASLGYDVALLGDSDRPLVPDKTTLESGGVRVIQWADGKTLEERIVQDLPWQGVAEVVRLAVEQRGEEGVRDAIKARLSSPPVGLTGDPQEWLNLGVDEAALRSAVGSAAKNGKGWFKRVGLAEELALIVITHWNAIVATDLGQKVAQLKTWAHNDG